MTSDRFLIVKFKSKSGQFFDIKYRLFDNPFVKKWLNFFNATNSSKSYIYESGAFYGGGFYTEEGVRADLIDAVNVINSYRKNWITLVPYQGMDQKFLSALHDDFERLDNLIHFEQWVWPQRRDLLTMLYFFYRRCVNVAMGRGFTNVVVPQNIVDAVIRLNVLIHRYEGLASPSRNGHIDVLFIPVKRVDFSDEDYAYFSPDNVCGWLYLTYGVTGVPPLDAFRMSNFSTTPVPQSNYTTGIRLNFNDSHRFSKMAELKAWFKEHFNWNADDPKLALGYIPLGEIQTELTNDEVLQKIREHLCIHSVHLENESKEPAPDLLPAIWPVTSDIQYHLKFKPYIQLPIKFNHEACLREATALLDKFVVHRNYDQSSTTSGKWKSLGINALNGDSTKTLNYPSYGVEEPQYSLTEVAKLCPETFRFLESVTELSQCQRVRFMLLEPGARISTHSDSLTKDITETTLAINIALNMPEGCEFWSCLNKDGSRNMFSQKLPMSDGTFFIFNNSQYHSVFNNSDKARIHIIIHGPIRVTNEQVLQVAQQQNTLFTRKALLNQVVKKFSLLGCEMDRNNQIYIDWLAAGQESNLTLPEIALAVVADKISDSALLNEALNFTSASLFPEKPPVIQMNDLDLWLKRQFQQGSKFASLVGAGTFLKSSNLFVLELFKAATKLMAADALLAGHLMHRPSGELPFLHEQFLLLDLNKWSRLGFPSLGEPYGSVNIEFPEHYRSRENIHDDYTPLWMASKVLENTAELKVEKKIGSEGWCTALMARAIQANQIILNVPLPLRHTKKFSYPRAGRDWQYLEIQQEIKSFLSWETNNVYVVNNEPLCVAAPEGFIPDQLISVSAGFKPAALVHQFWKGREPKELNIIDFSKPALDYMQELVHGSDPESIKSIMRNWFARTKPESAARQLANDYFDSIVKEAFEGDFGYMLEAFKKLRHAKYLQIDMLSNPASLCALLKPELKPYFWHSNAFSSNASLYLRSAEQLREAYASLAHAASKSLKQPAWVLNNEGTFEVLFGEDKTGGVFSAGYGRTSFEKEQYNRV